MFLFMTENEITSTLEGLLPKTRSVATAYFLDEQPSIIIGSNLSKQCQS